MKTINKERILFRETRFWPFLRFTVIQDLAQTRFNLETIFLYISSCIRQNLWKFGKDINHGKNNIPTKFQHFPMSMRADIQKESLRLNLGWAKSWITVQYMTKNCYWIKFVLEFSFLSTYKICKDRRNIDLSQTFSKTTLNYLSFRTNPTFVAQTV